MNNETTTNSFSSLTITNILALAASDNCDDNELAYRLGNRLALEITVARGVKLTAEQTEDLAGLVEVTDADLAPI
jgi:hypothetical protein